MEDLQLMILKYSETARDPDSGLKLKYARSIGSVFFWSLLECLGAVGISWDFWKVSLCCWLASTPAKSWAAPATTLETAASKSENPQQHRHIVIPYDIEFYEYEGS